MKLLNLVLRNFKGITSFELNTQGGNVSIFGDNATGKTTLFDAFCWLLFDKDSQNKKDFNIKTLDESGNVKTHGLNHEVEATCEINGRPVTLKKVYAEKYTQKRGSIVSEFSGHETKYWIDGVPKPKKEYDAFITSIVDEEVFKLLTNPAYFNEQLHWQKRRETLLAICGDISDDDVIASDKMLSKLPDILGNRSLEDHRKVIKARLAAINEEKEKIPVRIDEATRSLPDLADIAPKEVIQTEINSLKSQQQDKQQEIVRIENGGEVAEKQKQIREVEGRLLDIQNKHRAEYSDKAHAKKTELQGLKLKVSGIDSDIQKQQRTITFNNDEIKRCEASIETMRGKWYEANNQEFTFEPTCTCPTCKQELPEEQIEDARQKALEQFNLEKSKRLESINADGKGFKDKIARLQSENDDCQAKIDKLTAEKATIEQSIVALQTEIDSMGDAPDITANPEYTKALQDKAAIEAQIDELNTQKQGVIRQLQSEVNVFAQEISARESKIVILDQHEKGQKRIEELAAEQKTLAAEFERLEGELNLTDQFIRAKVNMLESRINSKFKYARFKLFKQNINGGIEEVCEATFNGVPYSGGLNNAARINVGLDIINTLSEHYGFMAPIFVDNREAVTKLIETKAQVISLVVSAADKALRVEYEGSVLKEAV
ncbi:AAA family ATPase [Sporomusa paucivorans]|uniref:AAA family ATPase n=1 Tax=Sporomusa paucivorans TaxID=2376 RepID=UPI00357129BE